MSLTTFKATVSSTDEPFTFVSQSRDFTATFEATQKQNGYNKGITPNECLLFSLGACEDIVAESFYKKEQFEYSSLYILLQGEISNNRPGFDTIDLDIHFRTSKSKREIESFVKFMEETCPVRDNLVNKVPIITKQIQTNQ